MSHSSSSSSVSFPPPTLTGGKRSLLLQDYLGDVFGAADESLAVQSLFEVSDNMAHAHDVYVTGTLPVGAETFFIKSCALRAVGSGEGQEPLSSGDCLVAPTRQRLHKCGEPRDWHFWASVTLAVARVTSVDASGILVEVLGWLSSNPTVPRSAEETGLLFRTKLVLLRSTSATYLVLKGAMSAGIVRGLCTLGPRHDAQRFKKTPSGSEGFGVGSSVGDGVVGEATVCKDNRVDCDGRRWVCTGKDWAVRLNQLRFPLRLMSVQLAQRLFQDLVLDVELIFVTADNLSFSPAASYLDLFKQTPRVRDFVVVSDRKFFGRFLLGDWRGRDCAHLSLVHCCATPGMAWARFQRLSCDLEVRCFLAVLLKNFELLCSAFLDPSFKGITQPLRDELEDVQGAFHKTGDRNVFFCVHECLAQWAMDIRTELIGSPHFPAHATLHGEDARTLLTLHVARLLQSQGQVQLASPYPHELDYTPCGRWANMSLPSTTSVGNPPTSGAVHTSGRQTSSRICGYHLAHLLGVKSAKGQLITCKRPTGCFYGPHDCTLSSFSKTEALAALEESPLMGGLRESTRVAIGASSVWRS
jgi:hypothetical protein